MQSHSPSEWSCYIYFCFIDYTKVFDCVAHNKQWKILLEMGIPDQLTCLLRNVYGGQQPTVRTGHGTMVSFQIGKGVCQGCIMSPCLFNLFYCPPYEFPWGQKQSSGQPLFPPHCGKPYMMQSTSCEILDWMKLESRFQGEISITSDIQMTYLICRPPSWQKVKRN